MGADDLPPRSNPLALLLVTLTGALVAPAASHAADERLIRYRCQEEAQARFSQGRPHPQGWPVKRSCAPSGRVVAPTGLSRASWPSRSGPKPAPSTSGPRPAPPARCSTSCPGNPGSLRPFSALLDVSADDPAAAAWRTCRGPYDSACARRRSRCSPVRRHRPSRLLDHSPPLAQPPTARSTSRSTSPTARAFSSSARARSRRSASPPTYRDLYHSTRYGTLRRRRGALPAGPPAVDRLRAPAAPTPTYWSRPSTTLLTSAP